MAKRFLFLGAVVSAAFLAACGSGGGGDDVRGVATQDTTLQANAANGPTLARAFSGENFAFPGGVPVFGTSSTTTVAITATGGTPTFGITAVGGTARGELNFASCIFKITESTFVPPPDPHPLSKDNVITVANCTWTVDTGGKLANGQTFNEDAVWRIGSATSNPVTVSLSISPEGNVTVNATTVGTTQVVDATAGSGQ